MGAEPARASRRRAPLPRSTTPLIGRTEEVAALRDLLAEGHRLITVVGLGGLGKTRVVIEAVQGLSAGEVPAPAVYWCDAAALASAEDLMLSVAVALGVTMPGQQLGDDPWAVLAAATATLEQHLVVLDALEGIADSVAAGLEAWLLRSPPTSLLVTSRRALGTPSEHVFALGPLPSGTIDAPATQLLLARARQSRLGWGETDLQTVATLAHRLDGWPLLIELFASEARAASPRTLIAVLDAERGAATSTPGRAKAAMESVLERAWSALSPRASRALTRLAAIDGAFDLELGAAVLEVDPPSALALLAELASHSLVSSQDAEDGESAHRVLDTLREYVARRGDPAEWAAGRRLAGQAILSRYAGVLASTPGPGAPLPNRDLERLFALVERGTGHSDPEAIVTAFVAARILIASFHHERTTLVPLERCARLVIASAEARSVPLELRLAVPRQLASWEIPRHAWDAFIMVVERWLAEAIEHPTPTSSSEAASLFEGRHELVLHVGLRHFAEWRYGPLLELLATVSAGAIEVDSYRWVRHGVLTALAKRGLGLADLGDGSEGEEERHLAVLARAVAEQGLIHRELHLLVNRVFLSGQLGRPHALVMAQHVVARCESSGATHTRAYALRELARIEVERGLTRAGLGHLDEVLGHSIMPRDVTETELERAATLLEMARPEDAWEALRSPPDGEETSFSRAYGAALRWAAASLTGQAIPSLNQPSSTGPTGSVEDHAIAIFWAIGRPELESTIGRAAHAAKFSTRVRQAVRVGEAVLGVTRGSVLGVSLDGASFRLGAIWQSLTSKPLLGLLLQSLVAARLEDASRSLGKDELGATLWPGDKSAVEHRDNRLHVAVASLRRLGLGSMLIHDGRGFRLDPSRPLVRLAP